LNTFLKGSCVDAVATFMVEVKMMNPAVNLPILHTMPMANLSPRLLGTFYVKKKVKS